MSILYLVGDVWLSSLFLYTGFAKIVDFGYWRATVRARWEFGGTLVSAAAVGMIVSELFAAIVLLIPRLHTVGAWTAASLGAVFVGQASIDHFRGARVPCGCAGARSPSRESTIVLRGLTITVLGCLLVVARPGGPVSNEASAASAVLLATVLLLKPTTVAYQRRVKARKQHEHRAQLRRRLLMVLEGR